MFHDACRLSSGTVVEADLCIVGAGAAGITLARALRRSGQRVCLLESGGSVVDEETQSLAAGEVGGLPYPPLERGRLRSFGGTTGHWAGWCRPPRRRNFASRPWVPESGWPFVLEEIEPYLREAQEMCRLGPYDYRPEFWASSPALRPLPMHGERVQTAITQFSPPVRFGSAYREELAAADDVAVWLHATAVDLEPDPHGTAVSRLHAATSQGARFAVRARCYVLATGGIENARLLLVAGGRGSGLRATAIERVGRFFADHLKVEVGRFQPAAEDLPLGFYVRHVVRGTPVKGHLCFSDELLERERLLECYFELEPSPVLPDRLGRAVWSLMGRRPGGPAPPSWTVMLRVDPAPNPESRVTLAAGRDRFGVPLPRVELRYGELERRSVARGVRLLALELGRAGLGRMALGPGATGAWPPPPGIAVVTGYHHMGTTRMHADPRHGVVDETGRVHGVRNLYVAGASVFPGYEGYPTLLLVALALRLAAHLRRGLP